MDTSTASTPAQQRKLGDMSVGRPAGLCAAGDGQPVGSQVLHALPMEIAGRAGVDPFDVSLPLIVEYIPRWSYNGQDMVTVCVEYGRQLGFIHPSRRVRPTTPFINPAALDPLPPDIVLVRTPRYAERNCHRRRTVH